MVGVLLWGWHGHEEAAAGLPVGARHSRCPRNVNNAAGAGASAAAGKIAAAAVGTVVVAGYCGAVLGSAGHRPICKVVLHFPRHLTKEGGRGGDITQLHAARVGAVIALGAAVSHD